MNVAWSKERCKINPPPEMSESPGAEKEERSQREAVIELSQHGRKKAPSPPAETLLAIWKHTDKRSDLAKLRKPLKAPKKLQREEELQQISTFSTSQKTQHVPVCLLPTCLVLCHSFFKCTDTIRSTKIL